MTATDTMNKYQWSALATSVEDGDLIRAALEEQVYSFGWNRDEAEGVIEGALASEDGIKKAVEIYAGKYQDALGSMRAIDLFIAYGPALKDFLGENSSEYRRARETFEANAAENYGNIFKSVKKAQVQIKNARALGLSDSEVDSAKNTLKRYGKVMAILATLEQNKLEALRPQVRTRATKRTLKEILEE